MEKNNNKRELQKWKRPRKREDIPIALFHKISSAAGRMRTLILDLLNYSHFINHEKLFAATNLNDTLHNVLNDFELVIEQKS